MDKNSADDSSKTPTNNSSYSRIKERTDPKKPTEFGAFITETSLQKRDNWHEWLKKIAETCMDGPKIERNVRWIEEHFSPADILISPKLMAALTRGIPIEGSPAAIRAKAGELSRQVLSEGSKRWKYFARGTLAATLREMEKRGTIPEDEIDVLISALDAVDFKLMPAACELMHAARERLSEQLYRSHGYYVTRAGVAGVLSELKNEQSQRTRCYLYWDVLSEICKNYKNNETGSDWAKLIGSIANNIASILDDLGDSENCAAYMKLSIIAKVAELNLEYSAPFVNEFHGGLSPLFDGPTFPAPEILDKMGAVPNAWNRIGPDQSLTFLVTLGAAAAQSELNQGQEKVTKSLFNAGVDLETSTKNFGKKKFVELGKAVLYAAGLTWALSQRKGNSQQNFIEAMTNNVGASSCAVNLMGSLISLPILQSHFDLIDNLSGTLLWLEGEFDEPTKLRLNMSRRMAGLKQGSISENPLDLLSTIMPTCLSDDAEWKSAWNDFASRPTPGTLGSLLAITGSRCCTEFEQTKALLASLLEEFDKKASNWPKFVFSPELDKVLSKPIWLTEIKDLQDSKRLDQEVISLPDRLISMADRLISD